MSQPPRPFFTVTDFHSLSVTTALRQGDDLTIAKDDHSLSLPILIALDIAALTGTCWAPRPTSAMSGALKHFFDTVYYPCLDHVADRPYGLWVDGNNDTVGATTSVEKVATGMSWSKPPTHWRSPAQLTPQLESAPMSWVERLPTTLME